MNIDLSPIQNIAKQIIELYRLQLDKDGINASGNLSNNIKSIVELFDTRLIISLELEDYWKFVEYGRGPGKMPPIDVIEQWIKIKPVIPEARNGKIPDTRQLAFLIARKIGREGTVGRYPIEKIKKSDSMKTIIDDVKRELVRQIKQQFSENTLQTL